MMADYGYFTDADSIAVGDGLSGKATVSGRMRLKLQAENPRFKEMRQRQAYHFSQYVDDERSFYGGRKLF